MAQYKYQEYLNHSEHSEYDNIYHPGAAAPNAGVYRCTSCGDEIGIAKGHTLPPQNHHQHNVGAGPIQWQLIVFAQQKN